MDSLTHSNVQNFKHLLVRISHLKIGFRSHLLVKRIQYTNALILTIFYYYKMDSLTHKNSKLIKHCFLYSDYMIEFWSVNSNKICMHILQINTCQVEYYLHISTLKWILDSLTHLRAIMKLCSWIWKMCG